MSTSARSLFLATLAIAIPPALARADFNETLTTHDLGSVNLFNGNTTPGPELDILYNGTGNSTPLIGDAIFSLVGVPQVVSATANFLDPQFTPAPSDLQVSFFVVSGTPGPIGAGDFTDPSLTPIGFLDSSGSLDITNALNTAILGGNSGIGLIVESVLPNPPFAFTGGAQIDVVTTAAFTPPPPLGGRTVPEPASLALVLVGSAFVGIRRRLALRAGTPS